MALLDQTEPPLSKEKKEDKKIESGTGKYSLLAKATSFYSSKGTVKIKTGIANFLVTAKNIILGGKYVPHLIVMALAMIVTTVNINQRMIARAFNNDIVASSPDVQYAITSTADQYTPLIVDDGKMMQDAIVLSAEKNGFATASGEITTEITERTLQNTPASELPDNSSETVQYIVKNGDTLSGLGMQFNVKITTIQYLNDIANADLLRPGSTIKIPKKGYEVSASAIAKKEKERLAKLAAASRNTVTRSTANSRASGSAPSTISARAGAKINGYPYGYCTYYIATRRFVPSSWGDARQWLSSARRAGYSTGSEPISGAIVVTTESWWGHVGYVESVNGNSVTIAEMNARGWGVVSRRTISAHEGMVRGYIY